MRFSRLSISASLALALAAPSLPVAAQQPAPIPAPAGVDGRAVVAEVRRIIAERYVLPERRPALDAILARGLASGRYGVADPGQLAERINADLDNAGHDRHLNFRYDPQAAAGLAARTAQGEPDQSAYERQARAANHGISELRVLPGNVRYMAYDGFMWIGPESAGALETAMRFLAGGDAVIIDLRRNGGGSPEAVQYLVSHFLPGGRPLVTFHMNGQASPDSLSTLAELPAGRMVGKPLYVLTSGGTASAAEEFTGHVGGYRIGELVGETTAGAGFRNDLVPIPGGFVLSVSVGRAVLASTGRDWEAVGLAPTMPTEVAGALDVAHALALRRLAAAAAPQDRARLAAIADGVAARGERRSPALPLAAYAGRYGERVVSVEDGRLYSRRGARLRVALIPLGGNVFVIDNDPALRVEFQVSAGAATAFTISAVGGPSQGPFARNP
ncbi:MAG TPA: S41 family peptidase [Allosphingosinicella sp.]|nr:S41 family peptidase [Allosphingosinicella sp.]